MGSARRAVGQRGGPSRSLWRVVAPAAMVSLAVSVAACSGASTPTPTSARATTTTSAASRTPADGSARQAWASIDRRLGEVGPDVSLLAAEVEPDGTCHPVHQLRASEIHPTASQFKLFVLGALADQIAAGRIAWDQELTIDDATTSVGNGAGSLQLLVPGTRVSVQHAAAKMIAISDNTAADMLIGLVGRRDVEAKADAWMAEGSRNHPFLTTQEVFLLHYVPGLADRFSATPQLQRERFLEEEVDPLPLSAIGPGYTPSPRLVGSIEWFATPRDVCRAFAGLHQLAPDPALRPLSAILSGEVRGLDLDRSRWPTVWYKGGSEPGVLTMGWLATADDGRSYVVEAMITDAKAPLPDDAIDRVVALAVEGFGLLGTR